MSPTLRDSSGRGLDVMPWPSALESSARNGKTVSRREYNMMGRVKQPGLYGTYQESDAMEERTARG